MTREELLARISINPNICFGKPCIKGHRIWVSLILDMLASGMSISEILENYDIEEADVQACIAYGAEMSRERYVTVEAVAR
ncbi:MAG: DUF433 domain-containing protein [Acidobacteria bacterium]|nr:DUF433 domain-containing protein [Acidobacteriota bacterium]